KFFTLASLSTEKTELARGRFSSTGLKGRNLDRTERLKTGTFSYCAPAMTPFTLAGPRGDCLGEGGHHGSESPGVAGGGASHDRGVRTTDAASRSSGGHFLSPVTRRLARRSSLFSLARSF